MPASSLAGNPRRSTASLLRPWPELESTIPCPGYPRDVCPLKSKSRRPRESPLLSESVSYLDEKYRFSHFPLMRTNLSWYCSIHVCILFDLLTFPPALSIKRQDTIYIDWAGMVDSDQVAATVARCSATRGTSVSSTCYGLKSTNKRSR